MRTLGSVLTLTSIPCFALNYQVNPLVSDTSSISAPHNDPNLINPWGLFFAPNGSGFFWTADNGSNLSTLYRPDGTIVPFVINVASNPTGATLNPTVNQFPITNGMQTLPAAFIFATENGTLLGFNSTIDSANAVIAVNNSGAGAVYKGLDIGTNCCQVTQLYAADFHNSKIDIFDGGFNRIGVIQDFTLPSGYAPFNVRIINDLIYASYAKQLPPLNHDDDPGAGHGFVNVFTLTGTFLNRLISQGNLNSPWGLALAPSNFGEFSAALLVGNFGDGTINAYDPNLGTFLGQLSDATGSPIVIDGLWSLEFNATGTLYFTSGPNGETHGLAGTITPL
jgi:uncharacterized protein (TIGR03118 family)